MRMLLTEIAAAAGGVLHGENAEITGFFTDSRQSAPGMMFVPVRGEKTDGHRFIPQVFAAGGAACFSEEEIENAAGPVVRVQNATAALQAAAAAYRGRFSIPVIGITGSVGKTTTKEMVALAVSAGLSVMKTQGNANSQIGLPITVCRLCETDQAAVLELGVSMPGEMARIAAVARPTLAIVTNIGLSHIEHMKTQETILSEKLHIADFLPVGGTVLVNGDDALLSALQSDERRKIVRFGFDENCDWRAEEVQTEAAGTRFVCVHDGCRTPVFVPAAGAHNVRNALVALAAAVLLGVDESAAAAAVARYEAPEMRQQIKTVNGVTCIDDTYNASPDSMRAALDLLQTLSGKRRFAVLADMLELGEYAVRGHFEVGTYAKSCGTDVLVGIGPHAKKMVAGFENPESSAWFATNAEAAAYLKAELKPGDVVLFKGSRGMHTEEILSAL